MDLIKPNGAFMDPLLIVASDGVRENLATKGIFIPILWPNVIKSSHKDSYAYKYSKNILPLPIYQRLGPEDMNYLVKEVITCLC